MKKKGSDIPKPMAKNVKRRDGVLNSSYYPKWREELRTYQAGKAYGASVKKRNERKS